MGLEYYKVGLRLQGAVLEGADGTGRHSLLLEQSSSGAGTWIPGC